MPRFLVTAFFVQLAINLGLVVFLVLGAGRPPHGPGPNGGPPGPNGGVAQLLIEELHLDTRQQQAFATLRNAHHNHMQRLNDSLAVAMDAYLGLLALPLAQRDTAGLQQRIARCQTQKASLTFAHFAQVRALCTPAQRQTFDALLPRLKEVMLPKGR